MTAPACPVSTLDSFYFGKPGAMVKLAPDSGITAAVARGEVAHQLADGGTATTRRRRSRRSYGLSFAQLGPDAAEVLMSYYTGSRGVGPWCLVDPTYRNMLPLDVCTMAANYGTLPAEAWSVPLGDGVVTLDTTVAPPLVGTAVARWTPATTLHALISDGAYAGTTLASFVPGSRAVPYLSDQPLVASVYARLASGAGQLGLGVYSSTAAGGAVSNAFVTVATLSTSAWTRVSVAIPAGSLPAGAEYVHLVFGATSLSPMQFAAAQLEYGVPSVRPWVTGLGVPRVTIAGPLGGSSSVHWRRSHGLTLAEV